MDKLEELITPKTKIIAITHVSNTLGTINPVKEIIRIAHGHGIPVMLDGAQAVAHGAVDVQDLDCDFYCFSGHKMYAPMGIGVMYGKERWLNEMKPYQGDVIGLRKAIEYMQQTGIQRIADYEQELLRYGTQELLKIKDLRIIGQAAHKAAVISFLVGNIHPYDMGVLLDHQGVAVRTGHHCTQPIMDHFGIPGTVRASFALYNTKEEIDTLVRAVDKAAQMLQ